MGVARGQVQHVAGLEHPFLFGLKVGQNFKRHVVAQLQIFRFANAPPALPLGLQQKHVVAVKVRPNASALRRVADHHII